MFADNIAFPLILKLSFQYTKINTEQNRCTLRDKNLYFDICFECFEMYYVSSSFQKNMSWLSNYIKVHQSCILAPCLLTYMQSISCEMLGWMKHKLESKLPGEISITSDM